MSNLQVNPNVSSYSVAGYVPGDRIGAGVVVDPATLSPKESKDTKIVNVDLNLNGKIDAQDDKVLVKLPPKGYVPAGWNGASTLGFGEKLERAGGRMTAGAAIGAAGGGVLGGIVGGFLAADGHLGAKLASNSTALGWAIAAVGVGVGITIAYNTHASVRGIKQDEEAARASGVPDMVQPKYILNQYALQQPGVAQAIGQLSTIGNGK